MTANKHTPGPWHVGEDGDMVWGPKWQGHKVLVANVPFTKESRVQADARLIASAPDMLEVLTWVAGSPDDTAYWIKQVHAAIAKATGGAA